jgi:membrane-associated protease RseP (regulator of RpoE activity)
VPRPRPLWVHIVLLAATIFTLLITGTGIALGELSRQNPALVETLSGRLLLELWRGIPYALALILILGAHELGHYFAARRHKIAVTLPYFIPDIVSTLLLPVFGLGTFGAFIQQQEPFRNRKVMFDIGAAGPLFGLVFAIPIVFIGLATSPVLPQPPIAALEGNSLLYALAKTIVFGRFLPADGVDVFMNQLAQAGWAGLLVTALNLIPMGQLDGGHIMFSLIGDHARRLFFPLLGVLFVLALFESAWVFWFILLFFFGRFYAPPLDMITRLDARRRALAFLSLFLFVVTFVPSPLTIVENPGQPLPQDSAFWMSMSVAVMFALTRLRRR